jgi:uncharacterized protein (TIGR02147 family)
LELPEQTERIVPFVLTRQVILGSLQPMTSYRERLKRELEQRLHSNSRYSLRAFARDLGLAPSRVSEVLSGRCGLSSRRATEIGKRLGWAAVEREFFQLQVEALHSKSPAKKKLAKARLKELAKLPAFQTLDDERFAVLSDWQHYAILELTYLPNFQPSMVWIARRLQITTFEATAAVERLLKQGLLKEEGGTLKCTEDFLFNNSDVPAAEIRNHHRQLLDKARAALDVQPVGERESLTLTFSLDPKVLPRIRESLARFRDEIAGLAESGAEKERVYSLSLHLFALDQAPSAAKLSIPEKLGVSP